MRLRLSGLHEGEIQYIKSQKKIYSIFPRLSAKQLKSQAMGGGKASQMAVQQRNDARNAVPAGQFGARST